MQCPDANLLLGFVSGGLDARGRERVETHIDTCADCAEIVAELVRSRRSAGKTTAGDEQSQASVPTGEAPLPPERIGRYLVLDRLGAGGMGEVFGAYDPDLDRKVALKILKARGEGETEARTRLVREAQAAAALTHRNVVTIYDVGTLDGQVFIAMEYVDGATLRVWQKAEPRRWQEVLAMYRMAADGLIAAHEAGIVHRDFKPDNVLVARNNVARVLDFGLAKPADSGLADGETGDDATAASDSSTSSLRNRVTRTGRLVGTPAYMAPEQFRGKAVGAAADQFSFCVALWEALYGHRPFYGADFDALRQVVLEGRPPAPPSDRGVPSWVERVLRKGLSVAPDDRHPSMRALLAALDRVPQRRRTTAAAAALGLSAAAIGAVAYAQGARTQLVLCDARTRVDPLWSAERQQRIEAAFLATDRPYAAASWGATQGAIDAHLERWANAYVDACEATHVRGEQPERVLSKRMICLDRSLAQTRVVLELFEEADPELVENAPKTVAGIAGVAACGDLERLDQLDPLPDDPDLRRRIAAVDAQLAEANAMAGAGRYAAAEAMLAKVQADAEASGHRPLLARAKLAVGDVEDRLGRPADAQPILEEALLLAEASGDEATAVDALATLAFVVGVELAHYDEGRLLGELAIVKALRVSGDGDPTIEAYGNAAMVAYAAGNHDDAVERVETAIAQIQPGDKPLAMMTLLNLLGSVERVRGHLDQARAQFERARQLGADALGGDHPLLGPTLGNLSSVLYAAGEHEEALARAHEALAAFESTGGHAPFIAMVLTNIGTIQGQLGEREASLGTHQRALALKEGLYPGAHPEIAASLDHLGSALRRLERPTEALEYHRRALGVRQQTQGADHVELAYSYQGIGEAATDLGQYDEAITALRRALELRSDAHDSDPFERGETEFALAKVLWASGRDEVRARKLAEAARPRLARVAELDEAVASWLEAHPLPDLLTTSEASAAPAREPEKPPVPPE